MRLPFVTAVVSALVLASITAPAASASAAQAPVSDLLAQLVTATPVSSGYDRALFEHWTDADSDGCDTRYEVLIAESVSPVTVGAGCTLSGGSWFSYFDGATWTNPSDVDVDHMVPLSEAWQSGAAGWTSGERQAFANDLDYFASLVAVTDNVNQSKGDSDPATWMPPATSVHCQYATEWVLVKYRWQLAVDAAEKTALGSVLSGSCGSSAVTLPSVVGPEPSTTTPTTPVSSAAPVYRFWSDTHMGHFYTISRAERDQVIQQYPDAVWKYEGAKYGAFATQQPGTVPLFRFWSDAFQGHFYTTSATERDYVIANYSDHVWKYERIAYYVYPVNTTVTPTNSVARFWSDSFRHHFYTASASETTYVRANYPAHVWKYESVRFKVPTGTPAAAPLPDTTPAPPPTPTQPSNPGDVRNCSDFSTYDQAYAWFMTYYPYYGDVAGLDGNGDGIPCESLPGAP